MFAQLLPSFRAVASAEFCPHLDWLGINGEALMNAFNQQAPQTLIHCDLRLDNVCFDTGSCVFLDWQLTRAGPAAYDVAYFLSGALAPEIARTTERELVQAYHQSLDLDGYPFDDMWRDYQRGLLLTAMVLAPSDELEIDAGRGQEMMDRWRERLTARLMSVEPDRLL
jgi:Ser/Thr protein kinase RdoA (MazF antagonist)